MTLTTVRSVEDITPITFATDAREVALAVYDQLISLLEGVAPEDWDAQTDCPAWTVADMVGHVIGAAKAGASYVEIARQQLWATRHKKDFDGNDLDALNDYQVRQHRDLSPAQRIAALREAAPRAVRGRMRAPRPLRGVRIPLAPSGSTAGMPPFITVGHLMEVIYTRDTWMHRVDIARATGSDLALDSAVDGRVVEDVVAEWAASHQQPFELHLTGAAGGAFRQGTGGERIELDAVEFCRTASGRSPREGLLATLVVF